MVKQAFQQQAKDTTQKEKFVGVSNGEVVEQTPEEKLAEEQRKKQQAELVDNSELLKKMWNAEKLDKEFEEQLKHSRMTKTGENSFLIDFADGVKMVWETAGGAEFLGTVLEKDQKFTEKEAKQIIKACKSHGWTSVRLHGSEEQRALMWKIATEEGLQVKGYAPDPAMLKAFEDQQQKKYNLQETAKNAAEYEQDHKGGETYKEWLQRKQKEALEAKNEPLSKVIDKAIELNHEDEPTQTAFRNAVDALQTPDEVLAQLQQLETILGVKLADTPAPSTDFDKWVSQKIDNAKSSNNEAEAKGLQQVRDLIAQGQLKLTEEQQSSFMNRADSNKKHFDGDKKELSSFEFAANYLKRTFGVEIDTTPDAPAVATAATEQKSTKPAVIMPKLEPRPSTPDNKGSAV